MCGIIGWAGDVRPELARRMQDMLVHRGPDGEGSWHSVRGNIWLGHRRLSIIDLSDAGLQPMHSSSGRYTIVFNGEIFNFRELRQEILAQGGQFHSHTDTEVILEAIEQWGIRATIDRLIGFFGIGLWDNDLQALHLIRDRIGVKPLYFSLQGEQIGFASEMRPLLLLPWIKGEINSGALSHYFHQLCVPGHTAIINGIEKIAPGEILTFINGKVTREIYWDLAEKSFASQSAEHAQERFEDLLIDSVKKRLVADVPVGVFLSGGLDSSLIAAIVARHSSAKLTAYSIGFAEASHDESGHAERAARHIGLPIKKFIVSPQTWLGQNQSLGIMHDEPFADVSSLPTFSLCQQARKDITVALSGDGGDEFYGGYPRYFWAQRIENLRRMFGPMAGPVASFLQSVPPFFWDKVIHHLTAGKFTGSDGLAQRIQRLAAFIKNGPAANTAYTESQSWISDILGSRGVDQKNQIKIPQHLSWAEGMMFADQKDYLVSDILTKVDRTSMAVGLE
ncbi:MAG TPA: asparagine synthase (glutamine-hydrolyzing), partial [Alphaproteobacteria bacterium]|nr:asparagine synthase (glutamine-hydrolyzing) [Alphaproteobacteria bacterium]